MNYDSKFVPRHLISTCIISFTIGDSGITPLINLVHIFSAIPNGIYLITTKRPYEIFKNNHSIHVYGIDHIPSHHPLIRVLSFCVSQFKIVLRMVKVRRNIDRWFFFVGGDTQIIPMLFAKVSGKPIYLLYAGSTTLTLLSDKDKFYIVTKIISRINQSLSNFIIVYSPKLIQEYGLSRHINKIKIAHRHIIDFNNFISKKDFQNRDGIIGYLGRLSAEKGTTNFIDSLPIFFARMNNMKVMIIGDGALRERVESTLKKKDLSERVKLLGWVSHDDLPEYLSEMKLLVIPSCTEGLPNAMLEAMACGVPILAASVGSIPDYITDEVTGFLMPDNSPDSISSNVIRALEHPRLAEIAKNGYELVQSNFKESEVAANWSKIMKE